MLKRLQRILILTVIAVIACGNGWSFAASASVAHHPEQQTEAAALDGHGHRHAAHNHADADAVTLADQCGETGCTPADHDNYPCCHTHGHCCTSALSLAYDDGAEAPVLGDGALLLPAVASVPLGTISYPLLRPPRSLV